MSDGSWIWLALVGFAAYTLGKSAGHSVGVTVERERIKQRWKSKLSGLTGRDEDDDELPDLDPDPDDDYERESDRDELLSDVRGDWMDD